MHLVPLLSLAALLSAICLIAFLLLGRLDARETPMSEQPWLRERVRDWLGLDHIHQQLEQERIMANEILTLLQGLAAQTGELKATQQAALSNIHNGFTRMDTAIRDLSQQLADAVTNNGKVTPEMQAAADVITTALADIKKGAETADDDFEPVQEPTPEQPTVPGDEPTGEVPTDGVPATDPAVEPGTDAPVTDQPAEGNTARRR